MFSKRTGWRMILALITAVALIGMLVGCGATDEPAENGDDPPRETRRASIGSTSFSEPWILAEMVMILLNEKVDGLEVNHVSLLEGSTMLHSAMMSGDLDMYISWTGTQFTGVLEMEVTEEWRDPQKVFEYVKSEFEERFEQTWLPPFGFNNTYAVAVRQDFADQHNLSKVSDLADLAEDMVIGVDTTFKERPGDGYYDMCQTYGFEFKQAVDMDYGIMYRSAAEGEVDAIVAYSTDGRIASMNLTVLEDDLDFFPPYDGGLVVTLDLLEEFPEIEEVLSPLFGTIDEAVMGELNARVDVHEEEFEDVARDFLVERGLIDN